MNKEARDLLKEWEGQEVYLMGTGNYTRRSIAEGFAVLTKVNRVKAKILFNDFENNWRIRDNYNNLYITVIEDNEYQDSGYMVFENKESYQDYKKLESIKDRVKKFFSGYHDTLREVSSDTIIEIHNLLGLEED